MNILLLSAVMGTLVGFGYLTLHRRNPKFKMRNPGRVVAAYAALFALVGGLAFGTFSDGRPLAAPGAHAQWAAFGFLIGAASEYLGAVFKNNGNWSVAGTASLKAIGMSGAFWALLAWALSMAGSGGLSAGAAP